MEWLIPWQPVVYDAAQMAGLAEQLSRELAVGHPLYGLPMRTLARRQDCDDVLFAIDDGSGRVAVVHLTWTRNLPERPPYPWAILYPNFTAWVDEGMRADAQEIGE